MRQFKIYWKLPNGVSGNGEWQDDDGYSEARKAASDRGLRCAGTWIEWREVDGTPTIPLPSIQERLKAKFG